MKIFIHSLFVIAMLAFTSFKETPNGGYQINDIATDFSLKNVDGKYVSLLSNYPEAQGFILIFTCNHCPFSVAYEDRIIDLHKRYAKKGFPVVAINSNDPVSYPADSYEKMIERADEKKFPFAYLFDETQEYAKTYGAKKTPHVYILRKSGRNLIVSYIGAIDDNSDEPKAVKNKYAENALNQILKGEEVSEPLTKAVGCSIKWKK